jgi:hypothetical protein
MPNEQQQQQSLSSRYHQHISYENDGRDEEEDRIMEPTEVVESGNRNL